MEKLLFGYIRSRTRIGVVLVKPDKLVPFLTDLAPYFTMRTAVLELFFSSEIRRTLLNTSVLLVSYHLTLCAVVLWIFFTVAAAIVLLSKIHEIRTFRKVDVVMKCFSLPTTQCACVDFLDFATQRNGGGGCEQDL
jgi:hypothetical protein